MKKFLLFTIIIPALVSGCSKINSDIPEPSENGKEIYEFESIRFFLEPGDEIQDTIQHRLDEISITNRSGIKQPDAVLYPYQAIRDYFSMDFDEGQPAALRDAVYPDSISIPYNVLSGKLYYLANHRINIGRVPGTAVIKPQLAYTEIKLSVAPMVKISVTGTYHRLNSHARFEAWYRGKSTGKTIKATGKWNSSIATTQSFNGSESVTIYNSPIE